jgi:RNA polymerase sigma-70 factor (ECF subfamily)
LDAEQTALSNVELVRQLQAGDEASFEALFLRHYERVYGIVFRLLGNKADAEDITQQVFLKLCYSPERIQVQQEGTNIAGWLYRVAVNEGYNVLRSQRRRANWHEKLARLWPFSQLSGDPARLIESQDSQARVRQILAEMKPREAELLLLRHSGLSYEELAVALEIAPGSVGSLLTQAKRIFARKYQSAFPDKE